MLLAVQPSMIPQRIQNNRCLNPEPAFQNGFSRPNVNFKGIDLSDPVKSAYSLAERLSISGSFITGIMGCARGLKPIVNFDHSPLIQLLPSGNVNYVAKAFLISATLFLLSKICEKSLKD